MTTLAAAVAIGDNHLTIDAPLSAGQVPGWVKIDSELLKVGGQNNLTGTTLVLGAPAKATHNNGATVTYAGNPFDAAFLSATGGEGGGEPAEGTQVQYPTGDATTLGRIFIGEVDPADDEDHPEYAPILEGEPWIDTIGGYPYQQKVRSDDESWDPAALVVKDVLGVVIGQLRLLDGIGSLEFLANVAGIGAADDVTLQLDGSSKVVTLQAGVAGTGLTIGPDGAVHLGGGSTALDFGADGSTSLGGSGSPTSLWGEIFLDLPTADPVNAGQLWNDTGVVKVSAG